MYKRFAEVLQASTRRFTTHPSDGKSTRFDDDGDGSTAAAAAAAMVCRTQLGTVGRKR